MSSEWKLYSLHELGRIVTGKTPKSGNPDFEGNAFPFITPPDFIGNKWIKNPIRAFSKIGAQSVKNCLLREKSVLITCIGSDMGKAALAATKCFTNQQINAIEVDEARFCPEFIYYNLSLRKDEIRAIAGGSAQPILNKTAFGKIDIFVPPLDEQKKISDFLRPLDDRIILLRETNTTLEAIAQALFKSWFVDFDPVHAKQQGRAPEGMDAQTAALFPDSFEESELGMVPKGWRVEKLGEVTERITKGTTPTTLKRAFVDSGINFIKAESMTGDGGFIPEKFAFIDAETHELLKRSQLKEGDVLISIAGTIGRIAVVTKDFLPANTNQAVALIRPLSNVLPSGLINRFLRLKGAQQEMTEKVVQAVQANLSLGSLSDLQVVVPPELKVNALYESGLAQIDRSREVNEQRMRTLAALRDTLLPRLISGQLRLPEARALMEEAVDA